MVPVLVVPAVATTAHTDDASGSASSAARSAGPVSRSSGPVGTTSGSTSMIRSVLTSDECAWSASATFQRAGRSRRSAAADRAATSAERFPADPPETKQPPAAGGKSARSASQRSAWFSA